jgi:hypothetical protein
VQYPAYSGPLEGHGPVFEGDIQHPTNDGTNAVEIYDTRISSTAVVNGAAILIRSGFAAVYDNQVKNRRYGIGIAVEDSPQWPRGAADYPVYHQPGSVFIWNNALHDVQAEVGIVWSSDPCLQLNRDYFMRPPAQETDGFTYTPYPYPHPRTLNDPIRFEVIRLQVKAFLEGPHQAGRMGTGLAAGGLIPFSSPHDGRRVFDITADMTDWVQVEFRETPGGSENAARHSAFLRNDGSIVDSGGVDDITVLIPEGNYYIIVRHRNHLPVMSAGPVRLEGAGP